MVFVLHERAIDEDFADAIRAFCDIEDDSVRVKLRSGVAIDGPGCVVLEFRDDKLAGGLCGMIATDPRLRVPFQLAKSGRDRRAMSFADPAVAANKSRQGYGLWRTEGRIPSGAMLGGFYCLSIRVLVLEGLPMLDKLFAGSRMFTF
jgi:hypothetical protein